MSVQINANSTNPLIEKSDSKEDKREDSGITELQDYSACLSKEPTDEMSFSHRKDNGSHGETVESYKSNQTNSKLSKELNTANSKESFLDNIKSYTAKRNKSVECPANDTTKCNSPSVIESASRRDIRFPVTAEAELESNEGEDVNLIPISGDSDNLLNSHETNLGKDNSSSIEGATNDSSMTSMRDRRKDSISIISSKAVMGERKKDMFCWRCHRIGINISCALCPRSYHQKCLKTDTLTAITTTTKIDDHWPCPECEIVLKAESMITRPESLKNLPTQQLCTLFKFGLTRMMQCQGAEPFMQPVCDKEFPEYKKYIVQPMDLRTLEANIKKVKYGSPQSFEADAKWLLHNSIIFNSSQSKLTYVAKSIMKICKHEMSEIEVCPSCYYNANTKKSSWFVEVCRKPHLLVWAKLKGFPYWPAKAMSCNSQGMVDVRFFGAHDRAWVPYKECYLYSDKDPNAFKPKRFDIEECLQEMNLHIKNLKDVFGEFRYAPFKTIFDPKNELKQIQILLPRYTENYDVEDQFQEEEMEALELDSESGSSEGSESDETSVQNKKTIDGNNSKSTSPSVLDVRNDNDTTMMGYGTDDDESGSAINLERRKAYNKQNGKEDDEQIEMEDDDEDDTQIPNDIAVESCSSVEQTKIQLNSSIDKTKAQRRKSMFESDSKLVQEHCPKSKVARRNSDMSVKSDTSRLSSISDKINRVDVMENMEISLGGTSENVPLQNSDSSRSGSEYSIEIKCKPVQVDIDNAEVSISPKLKIAEKLIQRLSEDSNNFNEKVKKVKRICDPSKDDTTNKDSISYFTDKSSREIDIDTENHIEKKVVDKSKEMHNGLESNKTAENKAVLEKGIVEKTVRSVESSKLEKTGLKNDSESTTIKPKFMVQPSITEFTTKITSSSNSNQINGNDIARNSVSSKGKTKSSMDVHSPDASIVDDFSEADKSSICDIQIDKFNIFNIIHSSLNDQTDLRKSVVISRDIESDKEESAPSDDENIVTPQASPEKDPLQLPDTNKENGNFVQTSTTEKFANFSNLVVPRSNTEEDSIQTSTEESSEKKSKDIAVLGEIRVKNLPKECDRRKSSSEKLIPQISEPVNESHSSIIEIPNTGSKRKLSNDEIREPQKKIARKVSTNSRKSSTHDIEDTIEIKSESESSDDDFMEYEDLEEKKRYLSALNISEKVDDPNRNSKSNMIRTRSKAEEKREKFRIDDNLSRVIDEVATNLNVHNGGEMNKQKDLNSTPSKLKIPLPDQRARKTFPVPIYPKVLPNIKQSDSGIKDIPKSTATNSFLRVIPQAHQSKVVKAYLPGLNTTTSITSATTSKSAEYLGNNNSSHVILLHPNPVLNCSTTLVGTVYGTTSASTYAKASSNGPSSTQQHPSTGSTMPPTLVMKQVLQPVSRPSPLYIPKPPTKQQLAGQSSLLRNKLASPNIQGTQNYIPLPKDPLASADCSSPILLNDVINLPVVTSSKESTSTDTTTTTTATTTTTTATSTTSQLGDIIIVDGDPQNVDELNRLLPESLNQALNDLFLKRPHIPKPRPPGILSQRYEKITPSSAGEITSRINSISHRMTDYFRGMLIETLEEVGGNNPEAKVASLELEIEKLKHDHKEEMSEMRQNFTKILLELQKSLAREREHLEEKVRAENEIETIKRIEFAKSKQWCANCPREAQFYCCWNTSYCDYPCQQKHWSQHMNNCTQHLEKGSKGKGTTNRILAQQPVILKQVASSKAGTGRPSIANKVYPRASGPTKIFKSSCGGNITVIETTPGNYELHGNTTIAIGGKRYSANPKHKSTIVSVSSPSSVMTTTEQPTICRLINNTSKLPVIQSSETRSDNSTASSSFGLETAIVEAVLE